MDFFTFGDYKACSDGSIQSVPDTICMTSLGSLRIIEELKGSMGDRP